MKNIIVLFLAALFLVAFSSQLVLTKDYRVVYNPESKEIVNNYEEQYNDGSKTYVPTHLSGFESDTLEVVEQYVEDNDLEYKEEEEELIDLE